MLLPSPSTFIYVPLRFLRLGSRKASQRPRITLVAILMTLGCITYLVLFGLHRSGRGRWWWNYEVAIHPALAYLIPKGDWGPIENPPRFVPEIYDAPWMGTWNLPQLSKPLFNHTLLSHTHSHSDKHRALLSPVILKLQVFSTVKENARIKRQVIRKHSPLLSIPEQYRHLVELKFVLGHQLKEDGTLDEEVEWELQKEQEEHGDLIRLDLKNGENLRDGKILEWIRAAGTGRDGGRDGWFLFKMDDDTVTNLPVFLDSLLELNPHKAYYLGTSLNRWPAYHFHFTGMLTGFSYGVYKTLAAGIDKMTQTEIEAVWDDDVQTGELMYHLPSAPQCRHWPTNPYPAYCDPLRPPFWGYKASPPSPDPRTDLIRYDYVSRMGDPDIFWVKGDVAMHNWRFKEPENWVKEWERQGKGKMWVPPKWLEAFAEE